ncbi:folate-binding protein YgfZ [Candidatus Methylospira mobilis]|uniref:Folate-binding protein YgfZ n=1 Tax=Candidatus Methylospira mobilis TaxID=1808979 RepID=A0A5Q0BKT4_9GAMM|nr:folate-binding protein YgfZ [Candidatus Methylospira mobilis]QFY42814.1 folate-binding protein YgfZ [Candidatus Methylospira mobilis]WNV03707.1 folate-binding protein YgfZ [Candidatus Methylospira mobilis]
MNTAQGCYCRLHHTSLLAFSGEDAGKFLQGQSTCDILALQQGQSTLGAFCSAKGRVIAVFQALRLGDDFFLSVNSTLAERLRQHLSRYILRAKVSISDVSADYTLFGVIGDTPPEVPIAVAGMVMTFSVNAPALNLYAAPIAQTEELLAEFKQQSLRLVDEMLWSSEVLRHGLPDIEEGTTEAFIPQMLNLDLLNGIGFKKGCYTGQEIVARTHYLGQCKRRMFRLTATSIPKPYRAGSTIRHLNGSDDSLGTVVSASVPEQQRQELLAVINLSDINSLPVGLTLEALPYTVEAGKES